jgi:hypothetical protein
MVNKERFVHTENIGVWRNKSGKEAQTNRGIIHYGNRGVHVVPANPDET